jgi:hypothetical protein
MDQRELHHNQQDQHLHILDLAEVEQQVKEIQVEMEEDHQLIQVVVAVDLLEQVQMEDQLEELEELEQHLQ